MDKDEAKKREQEIYIKHIYSTWYDSSFVDQKKDGTYRVVVNAYLGYVVPLMPNGVSIKRISRFDQR